MKNHLKRTGHRIKRQKATYPTFQSTVISSKENGNCNNTVSTSTFRNQSWKNQFSPSGVVPRDPTVQNITFSEMETHIKKPISPLSTKTNLGKLWTILSGHLLPSLSHEMSQEFSIRFESAHTEAAHVPVTFTMEPEQQSWQSLRNF